MVGAESRNDGPKSQTLVTNKINDSPSRLKIAGMESIENYRGNSIGKMKSFEVHEATPVKRMTGYAIDNELEPLEGYHEGRRNHNIGHTNMDDLEQDLRLVMKLVGTGASGEPMYQVFPSKGRTNGLKLAIPKVPPQDLKSSEKKKRRGDRDDSAIYIEAKEGPEPVKFLIGTERIAIRAVKRRFWLKIRRQSELDKFPGNHTGCFKSSATGYDRRGASRARRRDCPPTYIYTEPWE